MARNTDKITYPKAPVGSVAMFPRGAINHPALLASTCVLFDKVTILKPFDIEATKWKDMDEGVAFDYNAVPNPDADEFWKKAKRLVSNGVIERFETKDAHKLAKGNGYPPSVLGADFVHQNSGPFEVTALYSVGFSSYFDYLKHTNVPVVLSPPELHIDRFAGMLAIESVGKISGLSTLAAHMLSECIPEIGIPKEDADQFAVRVQKIRKGTRSERTHFKSFAHLVGDVMNTLLSNEEKVEHIETIAQDYKDSWDAYRGKMSEITRRIGTPLRFVSIAKSIVTLDFMSAAEKAIEKENRTLVDRQQQRSFGYLRRVKEETEFWKK